MPFRIGPVLGTFAVSAALFAAPNSSRPAAAAAAYAGLPLSFETNLGQTDRESRFLWHNSSCSLALTSSGAVLHVSDGTLRMRLRGARPSPEVIGIGKLPGTVNYFIGNDSRQWRTNIPTFAKVKYREVYAGVDLVFYGKGRQLEYDFIVAPGADPEPIRLDFEGASSVRVDDAGDLRFRMQTAEIRLRRPVVYQQTATGRRVVDARYSLAGHDQVAFRLAAYDPSQTLVIDPVLDFASYLGGAGAESAAAVAVDSTGNVYLTGMASGDGGFPVVNALPGSAEWKGAFVAKLNPAGSALLYSTYLGDRGGRSGASGIAVDGAGNVYVTGYTAATDFPTTKNALQANSGGGSDIWGFGPNSDAFVTKLNSTGTALMYSTYLGGPGNDSGMAITVDAAGDAIVAGRTDPNPNAASLSFDRENAFVAKINPNGSALVYMTSLAGGREDRATGVAVDASGNAYVTGSTYSPDFPTRNAFQPRPVVAVVYRSTDGGKVWTPSDAGLPTGVLMLAVDPQAPSTIYAATDRGVAKSIDDGQTWKAVNSGIQNLNIVFVTLDPGAPSTLYAIAGGGGLFDPPAGLYRSTDGAAHWNPMVLPSPDGTVPFSGPTFLGIDPQSSATLYLGSYQGLFKSIDAGAHWTTTGLNGYISRLLIDSKNPSTLYAVNSVTQNGEIHVQIMKTVDGGDNWAPLPITPDYTRNIILEPGDGAVVYADSQHGIEKSVDGGSHWRLVLPGGTLLAVSGSGAGSMLYASNERGIQASSDAGETWTSTGFIPTAYVTALTADPAHPGTLYVGLAGSSSQVFAAKLNPAGGIIYSTYLGGSAANEGRAIAADTQGNAYITGWTRSPDFPGLGAGSIARDDPGQIFVAKLGPDGSRLIYSTSFGGAGSDIAQAIGVDPAGNVYVAGSTDSGDFPTRAAVQDSPGSPVLLRSADAGITWSGAARGLPGSDVRVLAVDSVSGLLYAGGNRGVFLSRDRGVSWESTGLTRPTSLLVIDPRTPSTLYAAGGFNANISYQYLAGSGVFQSTDGGQTWRSINAGLPAADIRALVIDPETPSTLYCATSDEIFKTTDAGENWSATGPGGGTILALAVDPADPSKILLMRFGSSFTEVLAGEGGGSTWRTLWQFSNFYNALEGGNALLVDPRGASTIHALIWGAAFTTNDGGAHWRPLLSDTACTFYVLAPAPDNPSTFYAGGANYNGSSCLFRTVDGGASWTNRYDGGIGVTALTASRFEPGTVYTAVDPGADAFVVKLGADGATLYSTYLGGARVDSASALAIDPAGGVWVAGTTQSADFPVANALQRSFGGNPDDRVGYIAPDAFVVKLADKPSQ